MPKQSDIAGYPSMSEYPKWMYHPTEAPRMVKNEEEEMSYTDQGWSPNYIKQDTPKYEPPPKAAEPSSPEEPPAPKKK